MAKRADQVPQADRVVGYLVTNETGPHQFCNWCVKSDDPAFGTLREIRANQVEASYKCDICDRIIKYVKGPPRSQRYLAELQYLYASDVPSYIVEAGKSFMVVSVSDWQGTRNLKVTLVDIAVYYLTETVESGMRELAGHSGDWRAIDTLAEEIHDWFAHINLAGLKRELIKAGVKPWWPVRSTDKA